MNKVTPILLYIVVIPSLIFSMGSKPRTQKTRVVQDIHVTTPLDAIYYISKRLPEKSRLNAEGNLVVSYAKRDNFPRALSLLQEIESMNDLSVYINTINALVSVLPSKNRQSNLHQIISSVQNEDKRDLIIEHIVLSSIKHHDMDGIVTFISKIKGSFIKARVYKHLIEYYIDNDNIEAALFNYKYVQNHSEKSQVDSLFSLYYAKINAVDKVQSHLEFISDEQVRETTLSQLGKLFAEYKNFNLSIQYSNQIQRQILRDETLTTLVQAYVKDQKFKTAFQMSDSIQDSYYRSLARSYLAIALIDNGHLAPATKLAEDIEDTSIKSSIYFHMSIYHASNDDIELAFSVLDSITNYEQKKEVVKKLADYVGEMKEYHYALLILQKLSPDELKQIALLEFSLSFIQSHPIEKSISTLKDLITKETVSSITDLYIHENRIIDAFNFTLNLPTENYIADVQFHIIESAKNMTSTYNVELVIDINKRLMSQYDDYEKVVIQLVNSSLYTFIGDPEQAELERASAASLLEKKSLSDSKRKALISYLITIQEFDLALNQTVKLSKEQDQVDFLFKLSDKSLMLDDEQLLKLKRIAQGN